MEGKNWRHLFAKFLTLFLVGYCAYLAIEVTWKGNSHILMGVVGGISFLLFDQINNKISWDLDLLLQGCIGSVIVTGFELVIGEGLKYLNQPPMWNYSNMPFNYDGVICLPFSIFWIFLAIVGIFVADAYNYYLFHEQPQPRYTILGYHFMMPQRNCDDE